jgi:hypothetical protein
VSGISEMVEALPASQPERQEEEDRENWGRAAKYPCLRCKKKVGRNSVRCKMCQLWVHVQCGGISKEVFNILANPTKYGLGVSLELQQLPGECSAA